MSPHDYKKWLQPHRQWSFSLSGKDRFLVRPAVALVESAGLAAEKVLPYSSSRSKGES